MDTTQDPTMSPKETVDGALEELEATDPSDAPVIAERVADTLTAALNEGDEPVADDGDAEREAEG